MSKILYSCCILLEAIIIIVFGNIPAFAQKIISIDQLEGFQNALDEILIPAKYEKIGWSEGLQLPVAEVIGYRHDGGWGLISLKDKKITNPKYYSIVAIHKSLIIASIKGKFSNQLIYGVLNSKGEVVIDFKYHVLQPLGKLIAVAKIQEGELLYGLLNLHNKIILQPHYQNTQQVYANLYSFTNQVGDIGLVNEEGVVLLQPTLDSIESVHGHHLKVYQKGSVGLLDTLGHFVYTPRYKFITHHGQTKDFERFHLYNSNFKLLKTFYCDSVYEVSKELIVVANNNHFQFFNTDGLLIYESNHVKEIHSINKSFFFKREQKYFFIKYNGKSISPKGFDQLKYDKSYVYGLQGKEWFIFNRFGSKISHLAFEDVKANSNNLIPVKQHGYWGYLDHTGRVAIPIKYNRAGLFHSTLAKVDYLGFQYLINQFGDIVGGQSYDTLVITPQMMAWVKVNGRTDLIDHHGEVLFQTFNHLATHTFGFLEQTNEEKVGLVSHYGEVILPPIYDYISAPINKDYAIIRNNDAMGMVHFKGKWVVPMSEQFEDLTQVRDSFIGIKKNNQYGFIDYNNQLLIANRYDSIQAFSEKKAAVKIHGKWGFIDSKESLIVQPNYDEVKSFKSGMSIVRRNSLWGAIDRQGNLKIPCLSEHIIRLPQGYLKTSKNNKQGLYSIDGKKILQNVYNAITPSCSLFIVKRRGLVGLIDSKGHYRLPLKFAAISEWSNNRFLCKEK